MKKLLILGGSRYIIPVIKKAHELGLYVITCDYIPENSAHAFADEYCNLSIIEKDEVLKFALEKQIDGVISFACDPGVVTASYVAEKMGLPFQCSYESTCILQDKGLFRKVLTENGFNVPKAKSYTDINEALKDIDFYTWPVIVKPTDSAGSKGVSKVEDPLLLKEAILEALNNTHSHSFIIEDFLTFKGFHSSADLFSEDGKLTFVSFSDQLFDEKSQNQYAPVKIIWPSTMSQVDQNYLTSEIQRLFDILKMKTGIYNVETCVDISGKPYIMEISPRGGGCKIAEIQNMSMGVDLIENEIRKAVNLPLININYKECIGHWCEMIVHSNIDHSGVIEEISFDKDIYKKYIKNVDLAVKKGDLIHPFTGANMSLGDLFMRFDSREELNFVTDNVNKWLNIKLK